MKTHSKKKINSTAYRVETNDNHKSLINMETINLKFNFNRGFKLQRLMSRASGAVSAAMKFNLILDNHRNSRKLLPAVNFNSLMVQISKHFEMFST
jgi:hypothetical protein